MSDAGDDDWEGWEEGEEERVPVACLLCAEQFADAPATFAHLAAAHQLDILAARARLGLDFYGCIKLINYVRRWHAAHPAEPFSLPPPAAFAGDEYLQPVVDSDPLLQYDFDGDLDGGAAEGGEGGVGGEERKGGEQGAKKTTTASDSELVTISAAELRALRAQAQEAAQLRQSFLAYREAAESAMLGGATAADLQADAAAAAGSAGAKGKGPAGEGEGEGSDSEDDVETRGDGYFSSYAHFGIHEEMLKDAVRTDSYRDAILGNPAAFAGKVVLDVGCGTGILSMLAARAGARKVYAVDNSEIAKLARAIVKLNGLDDVVEVVQGRVEQVPLAGKVDIIISEWMGYGLLFESMLDSVLHARDAHLAPGGMVLPDKTAIYLVGLSDPAAYDAHVRFWDSVYTFDMAPMKRPVLREAVAAVAPARAVVTAPATLASFDLATCTVKDLVFQAPFSLSVKAKATLTAFCLYFDVLFEATLENQVYFSTSPEDTPTHWRQTIFYLHDCVEVAPGDLLSGTVCYARAQDDQRSLVITLSYSLSSLEGASSSAPVQLTYRL